MVHAPARHRGRDHRERQLPAGRLAAGRAALHRDRAGAHTYFGIGVFCLATCCRSPVCVRQSAAARRATPRARAACAGPIDRSGCRRRAADAACRRRRRAAASRCRCRRFTSSPTAAISATAPARGAQMLSLMLGFGIVSRLASGWICDRIGGLRTLLLGSGAARRRAGAVPAVRRAGIALRHLGAVRPVPGRHRAVLRHHRARVLFAAGGRRAGRQRSSRPRCSAWRSADGCPARSST